MNLVTNPKIKAELFKRWEELSLKPADVIKDAQERGMNITAPRLSRYKSGKSKEMITDNQLIWLCTRYGIFISYNVGEPVIENGKVKYVIKPYDEAKCLKILEQLKPLLIKDGKQKK